jgi:hypothetical protein
LIIEGGPQIEIDPTGSGVSEPVIELHKGERNFSVQACYKWAQAASSGCTKWANFVDELAPPPPPPPRLGSYSKGVDLPGSDYKSFETTGAADAECSIACGKDPQCKAWTWSKPGIQAPKGKCWLKNAIPTAVSNDCCISGLQTKVKHLGEPDLGDRPLGKRKKPETQPGNPPAGAMATVIADVEVYDAPGGNGNSIGVLRSNNKTTKVSLLEPCQDSWCHVKGDAVPTGEGYVYSGTPPDFQSLDF